MKASETKTIPMPGKVIRLRIKISEEEIVGLLWSSAGRVRMPPRCWPLQVALRRLESVMPSGSLLEAALACWPEAVTSAGRVWLGVDELLRRLCEDGHLVSEGRGWDSGYRPSTAWLGRWTATHQTLRINERAAVDTAAQELVATLTIWSKNSLAPEPLKSATS